MTICALEGCEKPAPKDRKYCCKEHYWEWLRQGNAPSYWQDKKRPEVGAKISAKLKGRPNLALKGRKFPGRENAGQFKPGFIPWNKGKEMTQEHRDKVREAMHSVPGRIRYGPDNTAWKGGIKPEMMRLRGSGEYTAWRKGVLERDEYTCQTCGQIGGKLVAHHIKRFANYPKLRFVLENGLTMCRSCHSRLHSLGYNDDGEPTEIIEFIKNGYNGST